AVALFSASLSKPSTGCFLHTLTSLALLWLGRASKLPLLSLYATFASDMANLLETNTNLA
ncbi:MAG: hypothetical protein IKN29_04495, partial [Bacteroidales bacterium]|nr:hypothetical protein [Bacteroidales bacterium]